MIGWSSPHLVTWRIVVYARPNCRTREFTKAGQNTKTTKFAATTCHPGPLDNFVWQEPQNQYQQALRRVKTIGLRVATHFAIHGSIMTADHLTSLLRDCFKDLVTAVSLSMGRMKCISFIIKVLGPTFREMLFSDMKACKYSLLIDKSTDVSATKENSRLSLGINKFLHNFSRHSADL